MTSSTFYFLLSLSQGARGKQEILDEMALSSAGRLRLGQASFHTALKRLLTTRQIAAVEGKYQLTRHGRVELAGELQRIDHTLRVTRSRRRG
jgi:hypothetical protein